MSRVETIAEGVTLYLGDCREVLSTLRGVDCVIADPPYGIEGVQNTKPVSRGARRKNSYASFTDSKAYVQEVAVPAFNAALTLSGGRAVLTPGNRCLTLYPEPDSFGAIYQPASVGLQPWGRADAQPILYYGKSPYGGTSLPGKSCSYQQAGFAAEAIDHPCPKPILLMKSIVSNTTVAGETILDPFMGSGTTGVAAVLLGRKFVGIEIEPKYFDIACKRIAEALKQPDMFIARPVPAMQEEFGL